MGMTFTLMKATSPDAGVLARTTVDIAIDSQGRIVSVRLAGQFIPQDSKDVVRRLDIHGFGEPVSISAP